MSPRRFPWVPAVAAATLVASLAGAQGRTDSAFQKFWAARSLGEAARAAAEVADSGVTFEDAFRRLKTGRRHQPAAGGVVRFSNTSNGIEHHYAVNVPENYDPSRRYRLRFQLHGGIGRRVTNQPVGTGDIGALAGDEQFYVLPYSWVDSPWWGDDQVLNLAAILDDVKRRYNIDENRVVLSGVSDGGTGAYYIGMRDTTPYASLTPLNGYIMVLANDDIDRGQLFPDNLRNKPFFVVNGGKDPLYPAARVRPSVEHLMQHGVEVAYHPQPEAVHNTAWWPEMKATYERFVAAHPRDPHPDRLTWQTADLDHNRAHWLVIDQLGPAAGDAAALRDMNMMTVGGTTYPIFSRREAPGRVDLVRTGNKVEATTRGVAAFTLLLSPDEFDFNQPVQVVANGRTVFSGRVAKSVRTLMKWAARDNDRTMLYGAEANMVLAR